MDILILFFLKQPLFKADPRSIHYGCPIAMKFLFNPLEILFLFLSTNSMSWEFIQGIIKGKYKISWTEIIVSF